jgi:yecA family protein
MMPDQIRPELENAKGLPARALAAAVVQAEALAPDVIALVRKAADGVHLLPRQENLLFFGLHALAAARRTEACPAFMALLRRPEWQLERLFGDGVVECATRLLLGLYDGNAEPLLAALEDRDAAPSARWVLFRVLARLSWEGRVPRERLVALIDRFDREEMAPPGDLAWVGWEDAIRYLGLKDFEGRVRSGWETGRVGFHNQADRDGWRESFERAVANPDDPQRFIEDDVVAMADPVASLAWLVEPRPALQRASEELADPAADEPADPAEAIRLDARERDWLAGFLESAQVPETAMNLEELDGFFTALVAGPAFVPPSEYMKALWGSEDGEGPVYDSLEQAQFVTDLLMRHWNTIAMRLKARFPHAPLIFPRPLEDRGRWWAQGFAMGLDLDHDAWLPLLSQEKAGHLLFVILSLIADEYDEEIEEIAPEARAEILDMLPAIILGISLFRDDPAALSRHAPAHSTKVGRNQPCPCGSGRKYKKCCGAPV